MTITEVSRKYDLSADTLRYYERIGLLPPVPRTDRGNRCYDEESCKWIELIKCMRRSGVQVEALMKYISLLSQGDSTIEARKALLIRQREQLMERKQAIEDSLSRLNEKIERYERGCMKTKQDA